jgi:cell division septation protein DedD
MEGETLWEGQGFTLVIFVSVVVLCSVFFILGMLVGGSQAAEVEGPVSVEESVSIPEESEEPNLTFYDSVAEAELPGLELPEPEPEETIAEGGESEIGRDSQSPPEPEPISAGPSPPPVALMLQIGAFSSVDQAEALRDRLVDMDFPAFVMPPGPDDAVPLNRVRVGPFNENAEAERVGAALEAEGFDPLVVR